LYISVMICGMQTTVLSFVSLNLITTEYTLYFNTHHGTIVVTCLVGLRTSGGCLAESQCGPEPACELTRTAWPRGDLVLLVILARPRLVKHGHTLVRVFQIFFFRFSKAVGDTQTPHHLNCFSSMCLYQYDARLR
jgi:hypothetical protein